MEYKLYLFELNIQVQESIKYLLNDNIESMEVFDELEFDKDYDDYIESLDMEGYDI